MYYVVKVKIVHARNICNYIYTTNNPSRTIWDDFTTVNPLPQVKMSAFIS